MDIHTNIHSVKYLCTTSAAITRLFRVSFYRGKKTPSVGRSYLDFCLVGFFFSLFL